MKCRPLNPTRASTRIFWSEPVQLPHTTWLVSSNPFDVIGAAACGWRTVWVKRSSKAIFDPWEHKPSAIISDLKELSTLPVFLEDAP